MLRTSQIWVICAICECNVLFHCGHETRHTFQRKSSLARDYYSRRAEGILVGQESNHVARDLELHGLTWSALSYVFTLSAERLDRITARKYHIKEAKRLGSDKSKVKQQEREINKPKQKEREKSRMVRKKKMKGQRGGKEGKVGGSGRVWEEGKRVDEKWSFA